MCGNLLTNNLSFANGMVAPYILCHSGMINPHYLIGATVMSVKTIGIDLAKNIFQVYGIDEHGKRLFNNQLRRAKMLSLFCQNHSMFDRH